MRGCSSEWSDLIGPCYLQCLAQALVVCITRLLSVRFESLGPRLELPIYILEFVLIINPRRMGGGLQYLVCP